MKVGFVDSEEFYYPSPYKFFKKYLFIWLCWVLVVVFELLPVTGGI